MNWDWLRRQMTPPMFSAYLRRWLFLYLFGQIVTLQAMSAIEFLVDFPLNWLLKTVLVAAIPSVAAVVGVHLFPPRSLELNLRFWGFNALALFGFWAGGYFLVGHLTYEGPFESMDIPLDRRIPFIPEWVFVYLTVYLFFLLPLVYVENRRNLLVLDLSQILALSISYMTFVVYPVAYQRPEVEAHSFATWALSVVQGKDPPWNCFPSTHCTASSVAAWALLMENRRLGVWGLLSTLAICVSTVMTKQHFVLDVVVGVLLGSGIYFLCRKFVLGTNIGAALANRLGFTDGLASR